MIQGLVVFVWLVVCAQQDIRQRQIANRLTLGALLLALFYLLWSGSTWLGTSRAEGLWALCLALLLTLPGYALGRLGAGDVKMLAALAPLTLKPSLVLRVLLPPPCPARVTPALADTCG